MNCRACEGLLPSYLDGDLSVFERAAVEGHLASCAECRRMLAEFESLEKSLCALPRTVPPWREVEARFDRRWGRERRHSIGRILLSPPAIGGVAVAAFGAALLSRGREITAALEPFGTDLASRAGKLSGVFIGIVDALAGIDTVVLSAIYGLLAMTVMLANARFALKWGRKRA